MENKTKEMEAFDGFATDRLTNHISELNTRYENKKIDKETVAKGYQNHAAIFSKELDDKIEELCSGQNDGWLKTELQNGKHSFIEKLTSNITKH